MCPMPKRFTDMIALCSQPPHPEPHDPGTGGKALESVTVEHVFVSGLLHGASEAVLLLHLAPTLQPCPASQQPPCPLQMQAMMANAGNVDPGMMRMAQQQFQNMSPADMERAKEEMSRMDPATMAAQARTAGEHVSAQQKYILSVSSACVQPARVLCVQPDTWPGEWRPPPVQLNQPSTSRRLCCHTTGQLTGPFSSITVCGPWPLSRMHPLPPCSSPFPACCPTSSPSPALPPASHHARAPPTGQPAAQGRRQSAAHRRQV
jgi:hypothetical protein